jgi:RNA polymerase sigma-70 factor (ECF subfamily)
LRDLEFYSMGESSGASGESLGSTSASLLERVKARDEDAWRRLVRLYAPFVLYWCRQAGLQEADRADLSQEVFNSVARHIADFRRKRPDDTFRGWLRTVTRSKLREHFRRHACRSEGAGGSDAYQRLLSIPEEATMSDDDSLADEDILLLRQALTLIHTDFEERTWQAFWRTTADGLPTYTVAEELGMTPAAGPLVCADVQR